MAGVVTRVVEIPQNYGPSNGVTAKTGNLFERFAVLGP